MSAGPPSGPASTAGAARAHLERYPHDALGVPAMPAGQPLVTEAGPQMILIELRPAPGGATLLGQIVAEDQRGWAGPSSRCAATAPLRSSLRSTGMAAPAARCGPAAQAPPA